MTRRTETASEAGRFGRACMAWRSPSSSRGRHVNAAGVWRRWRGLSREVFAGVVGCPSSIVDAVRRVGSDGEGRKAIAHRGEVSRGRSTSRDRVGGWEGLNAKPSVRTFVLVIVAMTAANPTAGPGRGGAG